MVIKNVGLNSTKIISHLRGFEDGEDIAIRKLRYACIRLLTSRTCGAKMFPLRYTPVDMTKEKVYMPKIVGKK